MELYFFELSTNIGYVCSKQQFFNCFKLKNDTETTVSSSWFISAELSKFFSYINRITEQYLEQAAGLVTIFICHPLLNKMM